MRCEGVGPKEEFRGEKRRGVMCKEEMNGCGRQVREWIEGESGEAIREERKEGSNAMRGAGGCRVGGRSRRWLVVVGGWRLLAVSEARPGPVPRERRRLEELLRRVLFADILALELRLGKLLDEELGSGDELGLSEVGVEDESLVL